MKELLRRLGAQPDRKLTHCFADKTHGTYLYVRAEHDDPGIVAEVMLSSFPNCWKIPLHETVIDPAQWETPEGIGIGSPERMVVRYYGQPHFRKKLGLRSEIGVIAGVQERGDDRRNVGTLEYLYSCLTNLKEVCANDLRAARMGFENGKLVWLKLSNSE